MIAYVDSSAIVPEVVQGLGTHMDWDSISTVVLSELAFVEVRRTLLRLREEGRLDDSGFAAASDRLRFLEQRVIGLSLAREVLVKASQPFATHVKTLDALHLATALLFAEHASDELIFVTADRRLEIAARAMGLATVFVSSTTP